MNDAIDTAIENLVALAQEQGDFFLAACLCTMRGARKCGVLPKLALIIQAFTKSELERLEHIKRTLE